MLRIKFKNEHIFSYEFLNYYKCSVFFSDLIDKCLLRKTPCGEDELCKDGECKCKYQVKDGEKCERKFLYLILFNLIRFFFFSQFGKKFLLR